jgi:hypothetical protein
LTRLSVLAARSAMELDMPVTLPPGRARLAMRPDSTASPAAITMGMVVVACFAAFTAGVWYATMTSTFRRTRSSASAAPALGSPFAERISNRTFLPST